ncbi:MAG TPA: hypothetical protein VIM75_15745 [Ohtaekwangia sp.]
MIPNFCRAFYAYAKKPVAHAQKNAVNMTLNIAKNALMHVNTVPKLAMSMTEALNLSNQYD